MGGAAPIAPFRGFSDVIQDIITHGSHEVRQIW